MKRVCCPQFPDWSYLEDNSSYDNSWCDDRIFNLAFVLSGGCGAWAPVAWFGYGGNIARLLCCRAMSLLRGAPEAGGGDAAVALLGHLRHCPQ